MTPKVDLNTVGKTITALFTVATDTEVVSCYPKKPEIYPAEPEIEPETSEVVHYPDLVPRTLVASNAFSIQEQNLELDTKIRENDLTNNANPLETTFLLAVLFGTIFLMYFFPAANGP